MKFVNWVKKAASRSGGAVIGGILGAISAPFAFATNYIREFTAREKSFDEYIVGVIALPLAFAALTPITMIYGFVKGSYLGAKGGYSASFNIPQELFTAVEWEANGEKRFRSLIKNKREKQYLENPRVFPLEDTKSILVSTLFANDLLGDGSKSLWRCSESNFARAIRHLDHAFSVCLKIQDYRTAQQILDQRNNAFKNRNVNWVKTVSLPFSDYTSASMAVAYLNSPPTQSWSSLVENMNKQQLQWVMSQVTSKSKFATEVRQNLDSSPERSSYVSQVSVLIPPETTVTSQNSYQQVGTQLVSKVSKSKEVPQPGGLPKKQEITGEPDPQPTNVKPSTSQTSTIANNMKTQPDSGKQSGHKGNFQRWPMRQVERFFTHPIDTIKKLTSLKVLDTPLSLPEEANKPQKNLVDPL